MAASKHQCLARLDEVELDKLDAIRSASGLSRSGAIRRLIRDFNIGSEGGIPSNKFIVDGQISKNIFMQLPIRDIWVVAYIDDEDGELVIHVDLEKNDEVSIIGFVNYPLIVPLADRDIYQHDILYWFKSKLYRSVLFAGESGNVSKSKSKYHYEQIAEFRETEIHLQQIFVV